MKDIDAVLGPQELDQDEAKQEPEWELVDNKGTQSPYPFYLKPMWIVLVILLETVIRRLVEAPPYWSHPLAAVMGAALVPELIWSLEMELARLKPAFVLNNPEVAAIVAFKIRMRTLWTLDRISAFNSYTEFVCGYRIPVNTTATYLRPLAGLDAASRDEVPWINPEACLGGFGSTPYGALEVKEALQLFDRVQQEVYCALEALKDVINWQCHALGVALLEACPEVIRKTEQIALLCEYLGLDPSNDDHRRLVSSRLNRLKDKWLETVKSWLARIYIEALFNRQPADLPKEKSNKAILGSLGKNTATGRANKRWRTTRTFEDYSEAEKAEILADEMVSRALARSRGVGGCHGWWVCPGGPNRCPCATYYFKHGGPNARAKAAMKRGKTGPGAGPRKPASGK